MISPQIIDDIKARNDIEGVISPYVILKRAGSNLNGLCPFHSEKTPSFTVFPATQSFYCFGCGAGGDAISFTMRMENIDYISAVRLLAKRSGIEIPEDSNNSMVENGVTRQRVLDMNREAANFFHKCLLDEKTGKEGLDYLTKKRKLPMKIINHFGLGFAPNGFDLLHNHLKSLGYKDEEMYSAFLCGKSRNNTPYDYFRNRVIFPIIDVSGNVIAFGGRVMDDSKPKYLNTSDTPAFKKSKNLFALNFAKNHCENMLILCEGYMDVIALHTAGFENAVATLGTAITSEQARIFSRYTKKVVISYDSDQAGQTAANKAFNLLQQVGIDVKILKMSGAKDPDEFIKRFGSEKFKEILNSSRTRFEFETEKIFSKYNINSVDEKIKASAEICRIIASFESRVERDLYCGQMSEVLKVPKDSMLKDVEAILTKHIREEKKKQKSELYHSTLAIGDRVNLEASGNLKASKLEEAIIGLMQLTDNMLKLGIENLSADDFVTSFNRKVFESMQSTYKECGKFDISFVGDEFSEDEISRIVKTVVQRRQLETNNEGVLMDMINSLKNLKQRNLKDSDFENILNIIKSKK